MSFDLKGFTNSLEEIDFPFYEFLTPNEIQEIKQHSNIVNFQKHDIIFRQQTRTSHIMYLKSGLVKIFKEGRMGKTVILNLDTSDKFIGLMSVFGKDIHEYSAAAVENTEILFIDIGVFRSIIQTNGGFAQRLINQLSTQGLYIYSRLMAQTHKQLPGRMADVLLYFSETIYKDLRFSFPLTRRELAELAGTTKESFIRTLTEFKNDKIIELSGSEVEIKSLKIVKTLSELG